MKKLIIAAAALMVSIAAYGQGQFVFNNRVLPDINARFVANTDSGTTSSIGTDYQVLLFSQAGGQNTALDPASTTFRGAAGTAAAGYVTPTTETVAGLAPGATASIVLRVTGPNIAGGHQDFAPVSVVLGGGTITPPNLPLGTANMTVNLVPEPSTLALGVLGLGALLAIRRRK